jgi:hypothetical protein
MSQGRPSNMQQHLALLQNQMTAQQNQIDHLIKLVNVRTEDVILRQHKVQTDINDMKLFLKTKLGAPDASRLKDLMKSRLDRERFDYR